ncbi:MAG: glycosyltransferase [Acidimicrobiia bacterium]
MSLTVLMVVNGLGTGGAERSLAESLPHLVAGGIRPVIACLYRRQEGVEEQVRAQGFPVHILEGRRLPSRTVALRRLLAEVRPDLIHTTIFEADLVGRLAAMGRLPVLTSLVNTSYVPQRLADPNISPWKLRVTRLVEGWTARHLTFHFHAISEAVKAAAVESLGIQLERITVVPRGRDPERLGRPDPKRRRRMRGRLGVGDGEVVVNVGRQEYQKGQRHVIEAVGLLAPHRPGLVLLVAGRGGHASGELERLAEQAPEGLVRFLGHREDVAEVLAAADLFAFPSLYEGLGGAVIEAMALGLPIVASDLPSLREVVEEGGNALLVPPGSPVALAGAIAELLDDRARARAFGARSREIFEARFTLAESVPAMISLYRRVVAGAG